MQLHYVHFQLWGFVMRLTETLSSTADAVNATSILTYLVCNIVTAETILLIALIYNFSMDIIIV